MPVNNKRPVLSGVGLVTLGLVAGVLITIKCISAPLSVQPARKVLDHGQQRFEMSLNSREAAPGPTLQTQHLANITRELVELRRRLAELADVNNTKVVYVERTPTSHDDDDKINAAHGNVKPMNFNDGHAHHGDDTVSKQLHDKVRVLCWIMTSPENLLTKAVHVRSSWGRRCNTLLFMSDKPDPSFPVIGLDIEHGREHLTMKTMRAFEYVFKNHFNDADWFMKADDDTYVIVENLRYMLSAHQPTEPIYFGHHFKVLVNQGYFSGGAGYVLSKEALKRFANRDPNLCAKDHGAEDLEMGHCMEKLNVATGDSRDNLGRSRFHCFNPKTHLHGGYPDWYLKYDKYGAQQGIESMSDYPVSFHNVSTQQMYDLEYFVYHINAYGIINGLQDLNGPVDEERKKRYERDVLGITKTTTSTSTTTTTTSAPPQ